MPIKRIVNALFGRSSSTLSDSDGDSEIFEFETPESDGVNLYTESVDDDGFDILDESKCEDPQLQEANNDNFDFERFQDVLVGSDRDLPLEDSGEFIFDPPEDSGEFSLDLSEDSSPMLMGSDEFNLSPDYDIDLSSDSSPLLLEDSGELSLDLNEDSGIMLMGSDEIRLGSSDFLLEDPGEVISESSINSTAQEEDFLLDESGSGVLGNELAIEDSADLTNNGGDQLTEKIPLDEELSPERKKSFSSFRDSGELILDDGQRRVTKVSPEDMDVYLVEEGGKTKVIIELDFDNYR